ncbi:MAG: replication restart helicase PriA [Burkholderiaceae bacterium]
MDQHLLDVWVPLPAHSGQDQPLRYAATQAWPHGTLVRVPLGKRQVLGVVTRSETPRPFEGEMRQAEVLHPDLAPLSAEWMDLVCFAAGYYQRTVGEAMATVLPPWLKQVSAKALSKYLAEAPTREHDKAALATATLPTPTPAQHAALATWRGADRPVLLHGVTGSGKTEVYLRAAEEVLNQDHAQVLVLVPEINLTPQLVQRFEARFGAATVAVQHSAMTPVQRLRHWLRGHTGVARVMLGTRLAVFASLPQLRAVVVDEEHDPSYKSQDGLRFHARDLAIYRGHQLQGQHDSARATLLGSATPSLESWQAAQQGRYALTELSQRAAHAAMPDVHLVDTRHLPANDWLAPQVLAQLHQAVNRGAQGLVMLNRRGYAVALRCPACGWKSACPHCSAFQVYHKGERVLRCHHCSAAAPVPRQCPSCGELDIKPVGHGTEQAEEQLAQQLRAQQKDDGSALRVLRMDADTTQGPAALTQALEQVHRGEVDVLLGTQMIAKGHDFRRLSVAVALDVDAALYSADFRAPERLFALLMQTMGRAGRDPAYPAHMWIQTASPQHPLFAALVKHDYAAFARAELERREQAALPPYTHQALIRCEARHMQDALDFLQRAREALGPTLGQAHLYAPVPAPMARLAGRERAQMLLESDRRPHTRAAAHRVKQHLLSMPRQGVLRWAIDMDPLQI